MQDFRIPEETALEIAKAIGVDLKTVEAANQLRIPPLQNAEIRVEAGTGSAFLSYDALVGGEVKEVRVAYNFEPDQGGLVGPQRLNTVEVWDPFVSEPEPSVEPT